MERNFYFTFGVGIGDFFKKKYVKILAKSSDEAREEMIKKFGFKWSSEYAEKGFPELVQKYNWTELKL